jgi:hypothetical protein
MSAAHYDLVFFGETIGDTNAEAVRARLMQRFGLGDAAAARLFSGGRVVVKRGVDAATAKRYQDAFAEAGARLQVTPANTAPEQDPEPSREQAALSRSRAAQTDQQDLGLAPLGAPLDEIDDRGPPQSPDISQLRLMSGDDWTLADCAQDIEAHRVPDTDHLRLEPMAPTRDPRGD